MGTPLSTECPSSNQYLLYDLCAACRTMKSLDSEVYIDSVITAKWPTTAEM